MALVIKPPGRSEAPKAQVRPDPIRPKHKPVALLSSLPSRCLSNVLRFPEKPWCCRRFRRIHPLAATKPAKWSPCGPQSHPRSHLPEDNDASKTAKLLRVHLSASSVLTASRLLRAGATLKWPARYVSGWGLHKAIAFALPGLGLGWWLLAYAEAGED